MAVETSTLRKIEQSLHVFLGSKLKEKGWNSITVSGEFPQSKRQLPWLAVEHDIDDVFPVELGTKRLGVNYGFTLYTFCENRGQREDLSFSLLGDEGTDGILANDLPVYELGGAYTGAYLWTAPMVVGGSNPISTGEDPLNKWRGVIRVEIGRT